MKSYKSTPNAIGNYFHADVEYNEYVKKWVVAFNTPWGLDYDERGTFGTGCKLYDTEKKATAAAKRYVKKFSK